MPMKKKSAGFLDLNMNSTWKFTRLKGGKKETLTAKRRRVLQDLLVFMEKKIGPPCKAFAPNCCVCEAWLAFAKIDSFFEGDATLDK